MQCVVACLTSCVSVLCHLRGNLQSRSNHVWMTQATVGEQSRSYWAALRVVKRLMKKHKVATLSSFGTRSSTRNANVQCSTKENDPELTVTAKVRLAAFNSE